MKDKTQILIIDLGGQYTQKIGRSLENLGYRSTILTPEESLGWIKENYPKSIILSGGSSSVFDTDAPNMPEEILNMGIPVLGIAYGMQWMAYHLDTTSVNKAKEGKSYGLVEIYFNPKEKSKLFDNLSGNLSAWSSNGDSVKHVPPGFMVIATSKDGELIKGMESVEKGLYALQFHLEVEQTENIILNNFVKNICSCVEDFE